MREGVGSRWLAVGSCACALALGGCSSAPTSVPTGDDGRTAMVDLGPPVFDAAPIGWASVPDLDLKGTTGGDGGEVVTVSTTADFAEQVKSPGASIILVDGVIGDNTRVT